MRIIVTNNVGGRLLFEGVEIVMIDGDNVHIWQPKLKNKPGCRLTTLAKKELVGTINVEIKDKEANGKVDTERDKG